MIESRWTHHNFKYSIVYQCIAQYPNIPVMATLILRSHNASTGESPSRVFNFYMGNAPITVSLDRLKAAITVSGSHTHDLHMEFLKLLEPIKQKMDRKNDWAEFVKERNLP